MVFTKCASCKLQFGALREGVAYIYIREAEGTVAESLVGSSSTRKRTVILGMLYRVSNKHQIRRGRKAARSSTSLGSAEPLSRESKAPTWGFLRGKLISDHDLFFSYKGQQGAADGQCFWGVLQGLHITIFLTFP